jgi:hypothetical protein
MGGQARMQGQANTANAMQDARLQSLLQNQGFIQQLLAGYFGQAINRRDPREKGGISLGYSPTSGGGEKGGGSG